MAQHGLLDSIALQGSVIIFKYWSSLYCCLSVKQLQFNPRQRPALENVTQRAGADTN